MQAHLEFLYFAVRKKEEDIGPHRHTCHELVYYLRGTGTGMLGESSGSGEPWPYTYHNGQFAVIAPDRPHWEIHDEETEVLFVGFHVSGLPVDIREGLFDDSQRLILHNMMRLKTEYLQKKAFYNEKLRIGLADMVLDLVRMHAEPPYPADNMALVERYMREHTGQAMDFQQLARMSGYSYHRFRHLFKERYGLPPLQHMLKTRLEHACRLLAHTRRSIGDIAETTGFSSESRFCGQFRRQHGCSPGAWRKQHGGTAGV